MKKNLLLSAGALGAALCLSAWTISSLPVKAETKYIFTDEEELTFSYDDLEKLSLNLPDTPQILSNFSENSYNYGDFLDKNNKAVYNKIKDLVNPSDEVLTIKLPETISVSLSALPNSSSYTSADAEALSAAVFQNCKPGIDSALYDYPEIYWLDTSKILINFADVSYNYSVFTRKYTFKIGSLLITPGFFDAFDNVNDAASMKEILEKSVEDFPVTGDTRYDQLKSIHDQIAEFTYYDAKGNFASSALGALYEPGVVCEGYSKAFKLICDRLDIPCVLVFGNYNETARTAHMWNYVMMEDGCWYAVDLTWDDVDGNNNIEVKHQYFLKGSDSFFTNHTEEENYTMTHFTYPELNATDYSSGNEPLIGDYNNDGEVNIADLAICQNSLLEKENSIFCDYNQDGRFDSFDILEMRIYLIMA